MQLPLLGAAHGDGKGWRRAAIVASELRLGIEDHGPGIAEADLARVVEPYVRLESSRSPETGGVGLGLSIARDAALLMEASCCWKTLSRADCGQRWYFPGKTGSARVGAGDTAIS